MSATKPKPTGKDKKAAKKAEQAAMQQRLNTVKAALVTPEGTERNFLADLPAFCNFDRNGVKAKLEFYTPRTMPEDVRAFVFDLTKENMETVYVESGWGWNDAKKKRELYDENARFIVFRRVTDEAAAGAGDAVSALTNCIGYMFSDGGWQADEPVRGTGAERLLACHGLSCGRC